MPSPGGDAVTCSAVTPRGRRGRAPAGRVLPAACIALARRLRHKAIDMERVKQQVVQLWAVMSAWVAANAQVLLLQAMEASVAASPAPSSTLLPTMKGVAFWNAAAAASPYGEASTLEHRVAHAVDVAVEWALSPVFYCCVLVDSLKLPAVNWPSPEIFSTVVVSLMLDLLVCVTDAASKLSGGVSVRRQDPPRAQSDSKAEPNKTDQ